MDLVRGLTATIYYRERAQIKIQPREEMHRTEFGRDLHMKLPLSAPVESECVTLPVVMCDNMY